MKYTQKNTIRFRTGGKRKGRRGSVIVLVVAVLALLAVIGTVYIVSARSQRAGATSVSASINMDYAQKAVDQTAVRVIGGALYDADGKLFGTGTLGNYGITAARRYDIHEPNFATPGYSTYYLNGKDQSWLCENIYPANVQDMSLLTPFAYNPNTGAYDTPYYDNTGAIAAPFNATGTARVVDDPASANDDAFMQLLPFSEANGTRYRFAVRIIDTSRMANLNVGTIFDPANPTGASADFQNQGTYLADYSLVSLSLFNSADTAANLNSVGAVNASNPGRWGAWNSPQPFESSWQQAALRMDNVSSLAVYANNLVYPFELSDETELRARGSYGTMAAPRVANLWPFTLSNRTTPTTLGSNPRRNFYTTYSWSRDLRTLNDPPAPHNLAPASGSWATLPPLGGIIVWPPYPAKVGANPDISAYTNISANQAADNIVVAATNIATAMELAGYSATEARAFAANYMTNRWSSWAPLGTKSTPDGTSYTVYNLKEGPSFIDDFGPCLRGYDIATNTGVPVNYLSSSLQGNANLAYIGFAAQPFINEAAILYESDPTGTAAASDSAVELYNPFDAALALDDFRLVCNGTAVPLTGEFIPSRGYFVATKVQGKLDTAPSAVPQTANKKDIATLNVDGSTTIYLQRRYVDRAGAVRWAAVDQYNVSAIATPPTLAPSSSEVDFVARPNLIDANALHRWVATVHTTDEENKQTGAALSLGKANAAAGAPTEYIPLYDRALDLYAAIPTPPAGVDYNRQLPFNIADFNRLMRLTNQIDPASAPVAGASAGLGAISTQLATAITGAAADPDTGGTAFPVEARIHFDFLAAPVLYSNPPGAAPTYKPGDTRAVKLLDCLAFTDRVSDYTIDLGDNQTGDRGISKLRVPGQINVNTASAEVFTTIPMLAQNPGIIGLIMAYRWRTTTNNPRIPAACRPVPAADFSNPNDFPGYGIRSRAELQVPLLAAFVTPPNNLYDRDQIWGAMFNQLTTRSDTFVVYAYLEAVRQNPRYPGAFNNGSDWYTTSTAVGIGVTDDPTDSQHALLRVARKRWVSIVDRSFANFDRASGGGGLEPRYRDPKIVAQKDLAQ